MKKIYVGNLSYNLTEQTLREAFEACGSVESVKIITDQQSGRSKGFGFIEMDDDSGAKAISEMNGKEVDGRALNVSEARPKR